MSFISVESSVVWVLASNMLRILRDSIREEQLDFAAPIAERWNANFQRKYTWFERVFMNCVVETEERTPERIVEDLNAGKFKEYWYYDQFISLEWENVGKRKEHAWKLANGLLAAAQLADRVSISVEDMRYVRGWTEQSVFESVMKGVLR